MKKNRDSNIELLRIIAMFFVLVGHSASILSFVPSMTEIHNAVVPSFFHVLTYCFSVVGVNVFVLISGWFSIHPSKDGLAKFIYSVLFLTWLIYIIAILSGITTFNLNGIKISMGLTGEYWFVMAYCGLYIFSPVLNSFAETASKKTFQYFLFSFYTFQCYYSWTTATVNYYAGYSIVLFGGLYLTAIYIRRFPMRWFIKYSGTIYLSVSLLLAGVTSIALGTIGNAARMLRYDNPIVILSSLALLITFSKFKFQNKFVNWLAASCFAVYVLHFNPFVFEYFAQGVHYINSSFHGIGGWISLGLYLIFVFILCACIDQLRIFSWRLLNLTKKLKLFKKHYICRTN